MTFDTVVVGAGLAGLTAALRLAQAGQRVALVAKGVGATHLAAGVVDVLGYDPVRVESPERAIPGFVAARPDHPYAHLSLGQIAESLEWFRGQLGEYRYVGDVGRNFLLPTAVGVPRPTALVPESMAGGDLRAGRRYVFAGFRVLKDFYPAYLAANLSGAELPGSGSVAARAVELSPPLAEADVGCLGLARAFEDPAFRKVVLKELGDQLAPGEAVGLPAVLGLEQATAVWRDLEDSLSAPVFEVPTLPPSVPGIRVFRALKAALMRARARVVIGAPVVTGETRGGRVEAVLVQSSARLLPYRARWFVLATGGFVSGGIETDFRGRVRENVFDLPVAGVPGPDEPSFRPGYFDRHPLARAGLAVDAELRPVGPGGAPVYENLHAAGAVLAGAEPWREKSGDGIAISTGYRAAGVILAEAGDTA